MIRTCALAICHKAEKEFQLPVALPKYSEALWQNLEMRDFRRFQDYRLFNHAVIEQFRYRHDAEQEEFIKAVEETGQKRMISLPEGKRLYRAQLGGLKESFGSELDISRMNNRYTLPFPPERMIPEPSSAKEGRVNPKGIPCLYLADDPKTAMSEVRPWIGADVSIGHFRTVKDLKVMDCAVRPLSLADIARPGLENVVWQSIAAAFSEPVTDSDMKADYAPTQVLAEVFKKIGCDGIKYKSILSEGGYSFALFNLRSARLFKCAVCKTTKISHDFSEETSAYAVDSEGKMVRDAVGPG